MALREGLYVIESKLTGGTVGRNIREDRSLLPKAIVLHPAKDGLPPQATWVIKPKGDGVYQLRNLGGFAIEKSKALYADIMNPSTDVYWKIDLQSQHGDNVYTITLPGSGDGWRVNSSEDWKQLAVGPLTATKSLPPQYHASGIYTIIPLDKET